MARMMAFVDGENLLLRFEGMIKKDGRAARESAERVKAIGPVKYKPGKYVWSESTVHGFKHREELIRVHYYTTIAGAKDTAEELHQELAGLKAFKYSDEQQVAPINAISIVPRVFEKNAQGAKTKSVDINLCVDVLEYVRQNALDSVFLVRVFRILCF